MKQKSPVTPAKRARVPATDAVRKFLTRREAADYLGIGMDKLEHLVKTGELHEHNFGERSRRYSVENLEFWAAGRVRRAGRA